MTGFEKKTARKRQRALLEQDIWQVPAQVSRDGRSHHLLLRGPKQQLQLFLSANDKDGDEALDEIDRRFFGDDRASAPKNYSSIPKNAAASSNALVLTSTTTSSSSSSSAGKMPPAKKGVLVENPPPKVVPHRYQFSLPDFIVPIFTPTAKRAKTALLHYDAPHVFGETENEIVHVVVVEPSQYEEYFHNFPEKLFLVLDADGEGVGYSRYIIQLFALSAQLELRPRDLTGGEKNKLHITWGSDFIWVVDDQLARFYKADRALPPKQQGREDTTWLESFLQIQGHPHVHKLGIAGFLRDNGAATSGHKMQAWNDYAFKVYKAVFLNVGTNTECSDSNLMETWWSCMLCMHDMLCIR